MKKYFTLFLFLISSTAFSQSDSIAVDDDLFDMSLEDLLKLDVVDRKFYIYGYINANLQKTFDYPVRAGDGSTEKVTDPAEWTPVKNFHIYGKGNFSNKISYLFNLAYQDNFIEVRNAWGNFSFNDAFQIRIGKMYRKFGLYNERLDQIPTFIGIEPPEMFDTDHLFLSRTTAFMIHGEFQDARRSISYAITTENAEGGPQKKVLPIGWDLRYKSFRNSFILGTSGFASNLSSTKTLPTVGVGEGPPDAGVLPWMDGDRYMVAGVFLEKQIGKFLIQAEYYNASHKGLRNPESVLAVINNANVNTAQRERFLQSNTDLPNDALQPSDVRVEANYSVQTWYVRLGYNIPTDVGQFVPYLFLDWMSHPEVIQNKDYGGDDEAGLADDGEFWKPSVGLVYRPIPNVAVKIDGSVHTQEFNGKKVSYPEIRLDFSFAFSNHEIDKALGQ
jgi:hypothetical protein